MKDVATARLSDSVRTSLESAAESYAKNLLANPACLHYLNERGIDRPSADSWGLGLVENPGAQHESFVGRLSIPYWVPQGGPVAMKFRCMKGHDCKAAECAKYLGHPGAGTHLYGVSNLATDTGIVAITEGELDAIVCTDVLRIPAVGAPGATTWRPHWGYLFEGYDKVIVLGDGDDAGRTFAQTVAAQVPNGEARALPPGLDVTSFVQQQGAKAVLSWLEN